MDNPRVMMAIPPTILMTCLTTFPPTIPAAIRAVVATAMTTALSTLNIDGFFDHLYDLGAMIVMAVFTPAVCLGGHRSHGYQRDTNGP